MDFKGSFECGNGERCDTFTVTDAFSRFVLYCQVIDSLGHEAVDRICDVLIRQYGVPERIGTDNGTPFSSISGLGISKLSVKWMRLGIIHERIEPSKPTQNGRHERLHRTLKEDTASPPAQSLAEQRQRFTAFQYCFNEQRPHQALLMQTPASLYERIIRHLSRDLAEIRYDERYIVRPVRKNGTIRWKAERCSSQRCSGVSELGFFRRRIEHSRSTSDRCTWESSKVKRQHSTQTGSVCHKPKHTNSSKFPDKASAQHNSENVLAIPKPFRTTHGESLPSLSEMPTTRQSRFRRCMFQSGLSSETLVCLSEAAGFLSASGVETLSRLEFALAGKV